MIETKAIVIIVIGILLFLWGISNNGRSNVVLTAPFLADKKIDLKYFVIFFSFWLFAVCVTKSYDISNYRFAYDNRMSHGKEPLFDVIQFYFYDHGWSFDFFKFVWVSVVVAFLYTCIKKYAQYPSGVVALALVTPLLGFVTQMRSALVGAVILNAVPLVFKGRIKDKIAYTIIVVLCAQIHILGYAFLIFLLINSKESKTFKTFYYVIIAVLTFIALFFINSYMQTIFNVLNALPFVSNNLTRTASYFQEGNHFRYAFFLMLKNLFLFFLCNKACEIKEKECFFGFEDDSKFKMIKEANTLMLVFLPIAMISASFERLFNCFAIIQYAMIFDVGKSKVSLFGKVSWQQSIRLLLVSGIIVIFIVESYFDSSDLVTIFNSVEWPF